MPRPIGPLHVRGAALPAPAFPCGAPTFRAATQGSAITLARMREMRPPAEAATVVMPPEDAFVALFQLAAHPAHDFRYDGKRQIVPPTPRGGVHIVDLRREPEARLRHPVDTLMIHLPRALLDEIAEEAGAPRIERLAVQDPWRTRDRVVDQMAPLLVGTLGPSGKTDPLLHQHLMLALAGHLATTYGGLQPGAAFARGALAPWQARRAKELLGTDLAKDMSLQDVADACNLSLAYFSRAFKVSAGLSPHAFRQKCRVARAKDLMAGSPLPLAEIAAACGFADQSHFSRVFAQSTGVPPGAWRRLRSAG